MKLKRNFNILVLAGVLMIIFFDNAAFAQVSQVWAKGYDGTANSHDLIRDMQIDNSGNVYITGLSRHLGTSQDITTMRYNSSGTMMWLSNYHFGELDVSTAIAIDPSNPNNIYVAGYIFNSSGGTSGVLIKYNSSGGISWTKVVPDRLFRNVKVDNYGNIYAAGKHVVKFNSFGTQLWTLNIGFNPEDMVIDASSNVFLTGSDSLVDMRTIKITSTGTIAWMRLFSTPKGEIGNRLTVDGSGNVYAAGNYVPAGATKSDIIIFKYNSAGTLQWTRTYDGSGSFLDHPTDIKIDNAGYIIVGGYTNMFGPFSTDYIMLKYDLYGSLLWSRTYNSPYGSSDELLSLDVDASRNIYVTGYSYESGIGYITSLKYNSGGVMQWTVKYGSSTYYNNYARKIIYKNGFIYVAGNRTNEFHNSDFVTIKYSQSGSSKPTEVSDNNITPTEFKLYDNYPNPFNPSTKIKFDIAAQTNVKLIIYNILGKVIDEPLNEQIEDGKYEINWDASNFPSGVYFYKILTQEYSDVKKMILAK